MVALCVQSGEGRAQCPVAVLQKCLCPFGRSPGSDKHSRFHGATGSAKRVFRGFNVAPGKGRHDAGGAIAGPGRIDVYSGEGIDAIVSAGKTRTPIEVYRLRRRR